MPKIKEITGAVILVEVNNRILHQAVVPVMNEKTILELLIKKGTDGDIEVTEQNINLTLKNQ